jgi:hypothetical protein
MRVLLSLPLLAMLAAPVTAIASTTAVHAAAVGIPSDSSWASIALLGTGLISAAGLSRKFRA